MAIRDDGHIQDVLNLISETVGVNQLLMGNGNGNGNGNSGGTNGNNNGGGNSGSSNGNMNGNMNSGGINGNDNGESGIRHSSVLRAADLGS